MLAALPLPGLIEIPFPAIDPVALELPGGFAIRWYGISYMIAFTIAYHLARRQAKDGFVPVPPDSIGDLLFGAILGVILGGRIGYILFYDFSSFAANPSQIVRIWEGGLSFHGGFIGALLATWWFARKHRAPVLRLGDMVTMCATPGIFLVRVANFINGELYGRAASPDVPWAMRFPTDPTALSLIGADQARSMRERERLTEQAYETGVWEQVREQVPLRHPSQLYEALTEGVLLGIILWSVYLWNRRRGRQPAPGTYGGLFLIGYGVFRSFVELFRQPDRQFTSADDPIGTVLGPLTMGQTLSLTMVLVGIFLVVRGVRRGTTPVSAPASPPARPRPSAG